MLTRAEMENAASRPAGVLCSPVRVQEYKEMGYPGTQPQETNLQGGVRLAESLWTLSPSQVGRLHFPLEG